MATEIKTTLQTVELTEVGDVVVTAVTQDTVAGDYVRDVRIFAAPPPGGGTAPLVFQLRLRSADPEAIKVSSPPSDF